jgi:hypothetical protein
MTSYWKVPAVVAVFVAWLTSPPAGLADASRREALRRQLVPKATRSLSNMDLPAVPPEVVTVQSGAASGAGAAGEEGARPPVIEEATGEKPAEGVGATRDEQWWRDRLAKARATLATDQKKAVDLQSRIDLLTTQAVNRDDPAQQAKLWVDRQVAIKDLEALLGQIGADQKAIVDIQDEARRAGVPPGWIR